MLKTFIFSFKLKNTYKVNTIIYSLKQIPIIKKILPYSLYQSKHLKIFANIISIILEILSTFLGKLLYVLLMIFYPASAFNNSSSSFLHIFLFLTIIGVVFNTYMFNPSKDKYYALFCLRIDAKNYTVSNYFYLMIKTIIGFLPFTILFGLLLNINIFICLLIPIFVASAKTIINAYYLYRYEKSEFIYNENKPMKSIWVITIISLILAYGLPYINIVISPIIFVLISLITIVVSIKSIIYVLKFNQYKLLYKKILSNSNINIDLQVKEIQRESFNNQINKDIVNSSKKGYQYFNDVFIKRHSKVLFKSAKKTAFIFFLIFLFALVIVNIDNNFKQKINELLINYLPYMVFIMYIINKGQNTTQIMFMNCDHSMLTYSFYRSSKGILKLFKERLKSLIVINLIPALIIAMGLPLLLYITGGTDNFLNYPILFISIISMSIFFSIHHLVLYYLLQPYNVHSETKSSVYSIFNFITYFACYYLINLKMPTISFGLLMILFVLIYSILSLILAYKKAPKTFKLRL